MSKPTLIEYAIHLQNIEHEAIGFMTRQALIEYHERGQIIPATEAGDLCGYMTYYDGRNGNRPKNEPNTIRIYQIAIQDDVRRIYHGTGLISRLMYHAQAKGFTRLQLWCATDLEANKFWRALGFTQTDTRIGGDKRGRQHNRWILHVPTPAVTADPNANSNPADDTGT